MDITTTRKLAWAICLAAAVCCTGELGAECAFKVGDKVDGFAVKSVTDLPEVKGRLVMMEYEKNGAELAWLDRDDENKTFAIGFRTLPEDDTGVAHILEHSVLCGSAKYPIKKPFVELKKSSFATFLNAWTSADATCYPVCSRNQKDFQNLIDVYMDAVLNPECVRNPLILKQEGWHYELDGADGELKRNGVVFSEMRGAFASPERRLYHEMCRLLFPDTTYGYVSGGDPDAIPTLTFDKFKAFYDRFYHPSNARIFLDGKMDVKPVLAKIGEYLSVYERRAINEPVQFQKPVSASRTLDYAIGAGENPEGKVYVATGWVCGRFDEREKYRALDILTDVLTADNASPLKKALIDAGLCEEVQFGVHSFSQIQSLLSVKGVKAENVGAVRAKVRETLARLADEGLDHARIAAILDRAEFHCLEKDSGDTPRGLSFYTDAIDMWHYGADPAESFRNASIFASLREKIKTGWFEKLLRECFLDNPHTAELTMMPSTTLAAERLAEGKKELAAVKAGWSREEQEKVLADCRELERHQAEPDRIEDVAKLPRLAVSDISEKAPFVEREIVEAGGVTVVRPHTHATGVLHAECYFSAEDFTADELADLPVLTRVLSNLRTVSHSLDELRNIRDGRLGRFSVGATALLNSKTGVARPYAAVFVSSLESRADDVLAFVPEVLRETVFDDVDTIGNIIRQKRLALEQSANGISGCRFAIRRATAQLTSLGAITETFDGIAQIRHLQDVDAVFAEKGPDYAKRLSALAKRLFTRDRLVVCLPDNIPLDWAARMAESFPSCAIGAAQEIKPFPRRKEGFRTLGTISGSALVAHPEENPYNGTAIVAARILSLGYLWDEIRVKGGAYGGSFGVGLSGNAAWASWNDPKPSRSLGVYGESGKALKAFADGDEAIDRYIVSAVAEMEPYLTPRTETSQAMSLWLSGRTADDLQRIRGEMLKTTKGALGEFAAKLDDFASSGAFCVVGGPQPVETCTNILEHVETLAR